MPQYLLLLRSDPGTWKGMSPEGFQAVLQRMIGWREKMRSQKILLGSNKLRDFSGKVVRRRGEVQVTDGPYTETKEVLGGYFLIEAPNYEAAVELCRECPTLEFGGIIEVREVEAVG